MVYYDTVQMYSLEVVQAPPSFSCAFPLERPIRSQLNLYTSPCQSPTFSQVTVRTVFGALVVVDINFFFSQYLKTLHLRL
jgi:hypothetical protein